MPKFYFNIINRSVLEDNEGTELPDLESARQDAHAVALELMRHRERMLEQPWDDWVMAVEDDKGNVLFSFRICEATANSGH
jgi:hypothetical protein